MLHKKATIATEKNHDYEDTAVTGLFFLYAAYNIQQNAASVLFCPFFFPINFFAFVLILAQVLRFK